MTWVRLKVSTSSYTQRLKWFDQIRDHLPSVPHIFRVVKLYLLCMDLRTSALVLTLVLMAFNSLT